MSIFRLVREEVVFSPEEVTAITDAFERSLQTLRLVNRSDPLAETVARAIIDLAKGGERDPARLHDQVLTTFGHAARKAV
jgi:hypothetical protein